MSEHPVFCIVVIYRPDAAHLNRVLASIARQTPHVILVDNTPGTHKGVATSEDVQCITLGDNLGIATAQNIGIRQALSQGADLVWLSDQDTIYPVNFLTDMLKALGACQAQGLRLADWHRLTLIPTKARCRRLSGTPHSPNFSPPNPGCTKCPTPLLRARCYPPTRCVKSV